MPSDPHKPLRLVTYPVLNDSDTDLDTWLKYDSDPIIYPQKKWDMISIPILVKGYKDPDPRSSILQIPGFFSCLSYVLMFTR